MTVADWLISSSADAEKRGLREVVPVLETLAAAIATLRAVDPDPIPDAASTTESGDETHRE